MIVKKKLAILSISFDKGGAETIISTMLPYFNNEYEVHLCLLKNTVKYPLGEKTKVEIIHNKSHSDFMNILLLPFLAIRYKKYLVENKIDYSLTLLERPSFIACIAKMFGWKGKVVVAENTTASQIYKKGTFKGAIGRVLLKLCYPKANKVISCSKYVAHDLLNDIGLKNINAITIYNGVNADNILKQANAKSNEILEGFWFAHMGSFYEVKNHELLVTAFSKICKRLNCKLLLIGKGEKKIEIDALIKKLDIQDYVLNLGFVENAYALLSQSACFVLSSNYEGLPTVLIEAITLGLPVVSTDCFSGPREIIAPNTNYTNQLEFNEEIEMAETGILTPIKNPDKLAFAMETMYTKYADFNKKDIIQKNAARFDIQQMVNSYIEILNEH
jgi:N-acetylgalactosamine-N,N'-diacetylbacillosaminyl-diphospho-undecaprenol 4-alpha-N-acetylgalactosaminyltransferase